MDNKRYWELERNPTAKLTEEELASGWHWCREFDFMLVGPGMEEKACCLCPFLSND